VAGELILIVDDNPTNLKLAKVVLLKEGYQIQTVGDAEEAIEVLQSLKPRLILMDINLPGMDGLTLTRKLKASPETKDIIIVALTAYAMKGDDEKARAAGCDGYIAKPIDTQAFPAQIAGYLKP
jgi:CheY-like chemotaxis protein